MNAYEVITVSFKTFENFFYVHVLICTCSYMYILKSLKTDEPMGYNWQKLI